jgi:hypothetical protein
MHCIPLQHAELYFEAGRDYTNNLHDELSHKIPSDLYKYKATLSFHTTKKYENLLKAPPPPKKRVTERNKKMLVRLPKHDPHI